MTSKLIIMDFDGPIAASVELFEEAYKRTLTHFKKQIPFSDFREWYDSEWENNLINCGFTGEQLEDAFTFLAKLVDYSNVGLQPGIGEALRALRNLCPMVIASTTPAPIIDAFLKRNGLDGIFRKIYAPEGRCSAKKELFSEAIREHGATAGSTLIIGDTAADIKPARELGCKSLACAYGWYGRKRLEAERPHLMVDSPGDLYRAARSLING